MPFFDRALEGQDQPQSGGVKRTNHLEHPYYGPDRFAMEQPIRDQPHPDRTGLWSRLRAVFRRRPPP